MRHLGSSLSTPRRLNRTGGWSLAVVAALAFLLVLPARLQAPAQGSARAVHVPILPQIDIAGRSPAPDPSLKPMPDTAPVHALRAQIAADCATLLKLASELKTELYKSRTAVLSLQVIRKAREIQELARKIEQEMKQSVAEDEGATFPGRSGSDGGLP